MGLKSLSILGMLALGILVSHLTGLTRSLDTSLADLRFEAARRPATGNIVLVDIDARSLAEVGVWPWPRRLHGELIRAASVAGAERIAFDIDFSTVSRPEEDAALADALANGGIETFLAAFVQPATAGSGELKPSLPISPLLDASWPASINVPVDDDGRVRRFPWSIRIDGETVSSLPSLLAGKENDDGDFTIDHSIKAETIPRVSYVDLLHGRVDPAALSGKSLIVGASAIELHDLFRIPTSGVVSGSTVIALAAETLLQDRAITFWDPPTLLVLALLAAGFVLVYRCSMKGSLLLVGISAALVEAVALWFTVDKAVMLQTAELQLLFVGLGLWSASREFDLRRLLIWAARRETQNTLKLLERVVDDGFDAIVIIDEKGSIARCNEAARLLLELPASGHSSVFPWLPERLNEDLQQSMAELTDGSSKPARYRGIQAIRTGTADRFVEYAITSFWMEDERTRLGTYRSIRYGGIMLRDVTDREKSQERLRFAALHDSLTGLLNRRALETELAVLLRSEASITLLAFDLDRFKGVNDALGHATGDAVLVETAKRAKALLPEGAGLFRIGGDEFVVLLQTIDTDHARIIATTLVSEITQPLIVHSHRVSVGTSVGIATNADGCCDASTLRRRADVALYGAKRAATERIVTFDIGMETKRLQRLALEEDLKKAIETDGFEVAYQPQVRLKDGTWTGAEALVRWHHPARGFVSPADFVPVAEEMGLIHQLGARVLELACREAQGWPVPVKIAVNVSPLQFVAGDVVGAVRHALAVSGLDPRRLELEITESAFVGENDRLPATFADLLALGVTFALDDFGTGYSSLGYLHRFPISKIKIDRSFVMDIPDSRHSMAVLRSVMALADGLAIRTIAEGIETTAQAELLEKLGCQDGQGYLFSKPVSGFKVAQLLLHQKVRGPEVLQDVALQAAAYHDRPGAFG